MRRFLRALALVTVILLFGFELEPEVSVLIRELQSLNQKIASVQSQKAKLEQRLEEMAQKIDELKAKGHGPIGRAQLERLLKNAAELSDQLGVLEQELSSTKQKEEEASAKLANLCNKNMESYANAVSSASTKEQAKNALEAYLAYRNAYDKWTILKPRETKEFLIPHAEPHDSTSDLKRKLETIDDIQRILNQLSDEAKKQLNALVIERELEKEILQKAELKRMFDDGEIETFGSTPSLAQLKRVESEIERVDSWLAYLEQVKSELADARSSIVIRVKELGGDLK